jgi:hypothetical protein
LFVIFCHAEGRQQHQHGIVWHLADSLALRRFVGIALDENTPGHSTVSRTRQLIDLDTYAGVIAWVMEVLVRRGLTCASAWPSTPLRWRPTRQCARLS